MVSEQSRSDSREDSKASRAAGFGVLAGTLSLGAAGTVIGLLLALFFSGGQRVVAYTLLGAFIGVVAGFVIGGFLGPRGTGHVEDESI